MQAISRAHRLGQQKTVLVLRLVSLGPEVQGSFLLGEKGDVRGVEEIQGEREPKSADDDRKIKSNHDRSYHINDHNGDNDSKISNNDNCKDIDIDIDEKKNIAPDINQKSFSRGRILSVEQQMLRTAAQKLLTEKLVLAQGMFDMGTSLGKNVLKNSSILQNTICDSFGKEKEKDKDKDKDTIASLFEINNGYNDNDNEEESVTMECSPSTYEKNSSRTLSMSLNSSENKDYFLWLQSVCDRGDNDKPSFSSATSPSSSASTSTSTAKSYPISHGIFRSDLMNLYNTPKEIMDWCVWLEAVAVSQSDRNDLQSFMESSLNLSSSSSSSLSCYSKADKNIKSSSSSSSSSSSRNINGSSGSSSNHIVSGSNGISGDSSNRMISGRKRANGSLSENSMWFKVRTYI